VTPGCSAVRYSTRSACRSRTMRARKSIIVGKLMEQKSNTYGYDAQGARSSRDFVEAGIVDPTRLSVA